MYRLSAVYCTQASRVDPLPRRGQYGQCGQSKPGRRSIKARRLAYSRPRLGLREGSTPAGDLQHRHVAEGVYDDVPVRQHHALRRSGRPCAGMTRAQSPAPDTRNLAGGKLGTVATRRGRLSIRGCTNGARFFGFGLVSFPARSLGSASLLRGRAMFVCISVLERDFH